MTNPLDNADMNTQGKEDIFGLFEYIGYSAVDDEIEDNTGIDNSDLKTTSVRLPEKKLQTFDAIVRSFGLTRNDAISYAMTQFMADAISGYAFGRAQAIGSTNFEQSASDERKAFLDSLGLDDETKSYLSNLTKYEFLKRLGVE